MINNHSKRIKNNFWFSYVCFDIYLMRKGTRIENVMDSNSFEVNILANVSAVVSPVGLFLIFTNFTNLNTKLSVVTVHLMLSLMYWWVM